jgi:hypothetical protein
VARQLFCVACVIAGFCGNAATAAAPISTTAESLLQEMLATYQTAKSYSDSGVCSVRPNDSSVALHYAFKTWFARPLHFRFDRLEKKNYGKIREVRVVMWSDGKNNYNWESTSDQTENVPDIKKAMWGFGGDIHHVPALLEARYAGPHRLSDLSSPVLKGEEVFEGTDCYHVQGGWSGDLFNVWLGKSDHLVRKILAQYPTLSVEEIHRHIIVDAKISEDIFYFVPPSPPAGGN